MPISRSAIARWLVLSGSLLLALAWIPLAPLAVLGLVLWAAAIQLQPVLWWPLRLARRLALRCKRAALLLITCCLAVLSGCGTVPLPGVTCPPVPAALLQPPTAPTLLAPKAQGSDSRTPGTTTLQTPAPAPLTAPDTGR